MGVPLAMLALAGPALAVPFVSSDETTQSMSQSTTVPLVTFTTATHESFTGTPLTTGALETSIAAATISAGPPAANATTYPADGGLHGVQPAPYVPNGGLGTNGSQPVYRPMSDYDYQSAALALYQEYMELDLFLFGIAQFSDQDFESVGLNSEDIYLLRFMAEQVTGHATALTNMLGPEAPGPCSYNYPVTNVQEYIDLGQKAFRWGESSAYGFLPHMDSRAMAQLLQQSIAIEARQQMIFRQFQGLFPMPVWFAPGIPQSWAWTLLAPFISSCPRNQTRLVWQNFPALHVLNQPNPARINGSNVFNETLSGGANSLNTSDITTSQSCINATDNSTDCNAAITQNRTYPLSFPGRQIFLQWDSPGQPVGPNDSYVTNTTGGQPRFALFVSQLNATYAPLQNVTNNTAVTFQPNITTYAGDPAVNGTMFLALTDDDLFVTPFNLSLVNPHVLALAVYQAG